MANSEEEGATRVEEPNPLVIPFIRQELAEYLSVDRSAMSAELSRMREEGLLRYKRNHFEFSTDYKTSNFT
jgi:DNA-binding MarR family transcriptional regulator